MAFDGRRLIAPIPRLSLAGMALCLTLFVVLLPGGCKDAPGEDGRYATHDRGVIYGPNGRWAP